MAGAQTPKWGLAPSDQASLPCQTPHRGLAPSTSTGESHGAIHPGGDEAMGMCVSSHWAATLKPCHKQKPEVQGAWLILAVFFQP